MRGVAVIAVAVSLTGEPALAQTQTAPTDPPWSFSASAYTYIVPESDNYMQPTVTADRDWLHVEARFNYEDRDTSSVWLGYNFTVGSTLTLEMTPMIGVAFGDTSGVAPGYKGSLRWQALELYTETEYVFDTGDSADSFLYTWSEFAVSPVEWLRFGFVVQRTKVYQTEFDIQRGLFAGVSYGPADFGAYFFASGEGRPTVVLSAGASF
jgi:hypothetical protein